MSTPHEVYKQVVDRWQSIHPVWTGIGAALGATTTALIKYRDVKKWFVERRDGKVLRMLLESRRTAQVKMSPGQNVVFQPIPFQEIVNDAGRGEKSVYSTLRRLEDRGLVHEVRDGWHLGPRSDALTFANLGLRTPMASRWGGNSLADLPERWRRDGHE